MKAARRILLIVFVVLVNVSTASMLLPFLLIDSDLLNDTDFFSFLMTAGVGALVLAFFVSIACIVVAFASLGPLASRPDQQRGLGLQVFVCKLLMIPYFVVTFAYAFLFAFASSLLTLSIHLASLGIMFGAMMAVLIPIMSLVNYLFLLATSSFAVSNIVLAYRKGLIAFSTTVVFVILQLFPIADVASYGFIVKHLRTLESRAQSRAGGGAL